VTLTCNQLTDFLARKHVKSGKWRRKARTNETEPCNMMLSTTEAAGQQEMDSEHFMRASSSAARWLPHQCPASPLRQSHTSPCRHKHKHKSATAPRNKQSLPGLITAYQLFLLLASLELTLPAVLSSPRHGSVPSTISHHLAKRAPPGGPAAPE